MSDISGIKASGYTFEVKHPATFETIGFSITLRPPTSPEVKAVERDQTAETMRTKGRGMTPAKLEAFVSDKLTAATADWAFEKDTTLDGTQPECTPANVRNLYKKHEWIREQVAEAFNDEARFYGADSSGAM